MSSKSTAGYKSIPVPVGTLIYYGSTRVPPSFLLCDGSSLSKNQYPDLFQAIGGLYGSADANSFNLPNLLTTQFVKGGVISGSTNPPNPATLSATGTIATATIPSLAQGHFSYGNSWNTSQNINGNNVYYQPNINNSNVVGGTITNAVKADSTDLTTWSASVNGGTIGFSNPSTQFITPVLVNGDIEPANLTLLPIIKAIADFFPAPTPLPVASTSTFPIIPASQSFYPPNIDNIYLNDPQLSGFIFT